MFSLPSTVGTISTKLDWLLLYIFQQIVKWKVKEFLAEWFIYQFEIYYMNKTWKDNCNRYDFNTCITGKVEGRGIFFMSLMYQRTIYMLFTCRKICIWYMFWNVYHWRNFINLLMNLSSIYIIMRAYMHVAFTFVFKNHYVWIRNSFWF